jgi:UDP-N-acetylglucosamine 2-epimerase
LTGTVHLPRVLVVMGTRPEAIKLAPVVAALRRQGRLRPVVVATSQHREMLAQALEPFALEPHVDLDLMTPDQTATRIASRVLAALEPVIDEHEPVWTVVQGDTTSAFAAAMASFYAAVPVAHVEAGLRTGCMHAPFPEEFNRRGITVAADLHFAPTEWARDNLLREGVADDQIEMVGNTVVDAVHRILAERPARERGDDRSLVLMTLHRRESFGEPMARILRAVQRLAGSCRGRLRLVYPVHPNPNVRRVAREVLRDVPGVELVRPLDYPRFLELYRRARFVMTDSGGVQEEAAAVGTPVLVLRDVTERPELIEAGWGCLVGTDPERVLTEARRLLDDDEALRAMTRSPNPFGDGQSGERIATALARSRGRRVDGSKCG